MAGNDSRGHAWAPRSHVAGGITASSRSLILRWLRLSAVADRLGDVGEQLELGLEPEHAIAAATSDLDENANPL